MRNDDIIRPPRSPDLIPSDIFLWNFWKSKVFVNKPQILIELKENIRREITVTDVNMLQRVMDSVCKRIANCIENEGDHLSNVIFSN